MTNNAPPQNDADINSRLMALENGQTHYRELQSLRQQQMDRELEILRAHNRSQDEDRAIMEEKLLNKIQEVYGLLWSAMKWLGSLFAVTLLTIVLKALKLL